MSTKPIIKYTDRDFDSIKESLIEHAKRFYPDKYNDFNDSGFGAFMMDAVAYVGDIMSYYLDFQVNEGFLETAIQYDSVRRLAGQMGYKFYGVPSAYGVATFYVMIPAETLGEGPVTDFIPILKSGSTFKTVSGAGYILTEDVDFNSSNVEIVAARFDSLTNKTTWYALRAYGQVKSGVLYSTTISVGSLERFLKVQVGPSIINEIISVYDSEGHKYYQVENLCQEVVYQETTNPNVASDGVRSIMKPFISARRFVVEQDGTGTYLQFGYGSDEEGLLEDIADPSSVVINFSGKNYISDQSFDPNKLLKTDKYGIAPSDTILTVTFISNNTTDASVAPGSLNAIKTTSFVFPNAQVALANQTAIKQTLEVSNDTAIIASATSPTTDEIRHRAYAMFAAQNRVVTRNDYEVYCYQMPPQFGSVKRASVVNDPGGTNRRLALYIVSENNSGYLKTTNDTAKVNLKTWLQKNKMINDGIDVYDAKIINVGFSYEFVVDPNYSVISVMSSIQADLESLFSEKLYIGEPLLINKVYNTINKVEGVIDTIKVTPEIKTGGSYAAISIVIDDIISKDGSYIQTPSNAILEIKYLSVDIQGAAV